MYRLLARLALVVLLMPATLLAQDRPAPLDVLDLSASAGSEVASDTAVVTLGAVREGSDVSALTQDVDSTLTHALNEAKATPGVQAASGGFSTQPRYDNKQNQTGWTVHGELIFKSHDFAALGKLIGRLTAAPVAMQITASGFELSPELRQSEEALLIERAIAAFKSKANTASKALGYGSWTIREVHVGNAGGANAPRAMFSRAMSPAPVAMPLEPGRSTLEVEVTGSVQMRH